MGEVPPPDIEKLLHHGAKVRRLHPDRWTDLEAPPPEDPVKVLARQYEVAHGEAERMVDGVQFVVDGLVAAVAELEWLAEQQLDHNPIDPDGPLVPALADPAALRAAADDVRGAARTVLAEHGGWQELRDQLARTYEWYASLSGGGAR